MGVDQLTEDPSSSGQKDIVFVKSLADDTKVSIPGVKRPWLSEAEGFILPNHDTGRILPAESQRNTIDPSVAITDSSATEYDSADESSVCSTLVPLLKTLDGAELVSGPKTIKSILKSKSTFKAKTLKGVIINELSSAPAKGNKALQLQKLTQLLLCYIRKPIWYLDSRCSRHMTGVKSYLHKYIEQPGSKVVFGDDSTCTTEGYGSIKCNGIVFTKVAFINGLKYSLINISQLCDAKYIVQFDEIKSNDVSFIEPYECPELVVLETEVSSDQNGQTAQNDQNDQSAQTDEILNDDYVEDTSVQNTIPIPNSSLSISSMVTPAPQDKWSQDKHIELVNIIGNPGARMLIRAMAKQLSAALAHGCLFVDFLSEEEPKKVSEALQHPGWVDAIQDELNQFARNKVGTLVSAPYGKTIIGSKWVFRNKRDETRIVIKNKARLVAQGYNQQEGIDYDETFARCKT
ncbi:retrovirus-related pol polyprotein from transposon TNT 1-94 [Tanacetum coccineum]